MLFRSASTGMPDPGSLRSDRVRGRPGANLANAGERVWSQQFDHLDELAVHDTRDGTDLQLRVRVPDVDVVVEVLSRPITPFGGLVRRARSFIRFFHAQWWIPNRSFARMHSRCVGSAPQEPDGAKVGLLLGELEMSCSPLFLRVLRHLDRSRVDGDPNAP